MIIKKQDLISLGSLIYLIQFISITVILFKEKKNYLYFFSPSYLCILYLSLNFIVGHYVAYKGIGDLRYYNLLRDYDNIAFIIIFFLLCNLFVFIAIDFKRIENTSLIRFHLKNKISSICGYVILFVIFLLCFININLSFWGGSGDFGYPLRLGLAIILIYIVNRKQVYRYFYYLLLLVLFLVTSYDSKREILYCVILIVLFELLKKDRSFTFGLKQLLSFLFIGVIIFLIITTSSIARGYGQYDVKNPIESIFHVNNYIHSENFIDNLADNFELPCDYGNTCTAINYVYKGETNLLYGTTFLKFIFTLIPTNVFPEKPKRMVEIFTQKFSPAFAAKGGSYPIFIYAEAFWNFNLLALFFLYIIFSFFNRLYSKMIIYLKQDIINIYSFFLIYMYITIIQFIRGSGFDLWLVYALIAIPTSYMAIKLFKLDKSVKKQ